MKHFKINKLEFVSAISVFIITASVNAIDLPRDSLRSAKLTYDEKDRIISIDGPGERETKLDYDDHGRIHSVTNSDGRVKYYYNSLDQLTGLDDNTGTSKFGYDSFGRLASMKYPQGGEIKYDYTESGTISSVMWDPKHFLNYERDLFGNIIAMETPAGLFQIRYDYDNRVMQRYYPNGAFSHFSYGTDGRPLIIRHITPDNNLALEFRYKYNDAGLLETAYEWTRNSKVEINYRYDGFGQLLEARYSDGRIYTYEYDINGNCVKWTDPAREYKATYNEIDQMTSFNGQPVEHDAYGNVILIDSGKYAFNNADELSDNGPKSYNYNGLGLRVKSQDTDEKIEYFHLIDELPYVFLETGNYVKQYFWADGQVLGQSDSNNSELFFFEDQLGSIRAAINKKGDIVRYAEFSPFGSPVKRIDGVKFGFAGEEQDCQGNIYLRSRFYKPDICRFLSIDAGFPQLTSEIINNRYAYGANSPLNYKDKSGFWPVFNSFWWSGFAWNFYAGLVQDTRFSYHYWRSKFGLPQTFPTEGRVMPDAQYVLDEIKSHYYHYISLKGWDVSLTSDKQRLDANRYALTQFSKEHSGVPGFVGPKFQNILNTEIDGINVDWFASIGFLKSNMGILRFIPSEYLYTVTKPAWLISREQDAEFESLYKMFPESNWNAVDLVEGIWTGKIDIGSMKGLNSLPSNNPNVGGVYLDKAAEVIGELGSVDGIVFDPVSNRVALIGQDAGQMNLPPLNLEDLATAYRTVFGNYSTEPGVTIDPDSKNPYADSMNVVFFGGTENTHFGHKLLEADRIMKGLSLGEDNITHKKMGVGISGYYNLLELGFSNLGGTYNKDLWSRFWIVPDHVIVKVSEDRNSISFPDTRMRVKTETMQWENNRLVPAAGQTDEKAEYFAAHFTKYYDEYAEEYPVFQEIKNLANLVGLFKWLKEAGKEVDLAWLEKYEKSFRTPGKTPSLTVSGSRQNQRGSIQTISIFGGTDLTVNNFYIKDDGITSEYSKKTMKAISGKPGIARGEFETDDGKMKKVVAMTTSQTRAPGSILINGDELKLINRMFCSFHNSPGPFGYSWGIDLPKLKIIRQDRRKAIYKIAEGEKVEIVDFNLISPFGLQEIMFKKDTLDQRTGRIVFLPEKLSNIKGLYPEKDNYRVEYFNGRVEKFDTGGNIVSVSLTSENQVKYSYNNSGSLEAVIQIENGITDYKIEFNYDNQGRVKIAEVNGKEIRYEYDGSGNLIRVLSSEGRTDYKYNKQHLVTEININGKLYESFEYDEFGRIRQHEISNSEPVTAKIQTIENEIIITRSSGDQTIISKYDEGGRILELTDGSGNSIKNKYYKSGSLAQKEYINHFGDKVKVDYSPDGRYIKHTDSEGIIRALLYDEFGQLVQIQDEKNALLINDYISTADGWMETSEDAGEKVQILYDESSNLKEQIISGKNPMHGELITEMEYGDDKMLQKLITQGLVSDIRIFDKGRLIEQDAGNQKTFYSYDINGRLSKMSESGSKLELLYDSTGKIASSELIKGNLKETNLYNDGRLIKRISSSGLDDSFQYNERGELEKIIRADGESWIIERDGNKTSCKRNNTVQLEFIRDDQGRLVQMIY